MADNVPLPAASGAAAADEVAYSGDTTKVQLVRLVHVSGAEGSKTLSEIADTSGLEVQGSVAHDAADAGNPVGLGGRAETIGTLPTAVAAGDRVALMATRHGVLFTLGGSPGVVTTRAANITTAVSNTVIGPTISSGQRLVITRLTVTIDSASTVFPSVLIGFAAATTPTGDGVIAYHGGLMAGGGFTIGDGSGIVGIGAADEELRITTVGNAGGNGISVSITYYIATA